MKKPPNADTTMNNDDHACDESWIALEAATRNVVVLLRLKKLPAAPVTGAESGTADFTSDTLRETDGLKLVAEAQSAQSNAPLILNHAGCGHREQRN